MVIAAHAPVVCQMGSSQGSMRPRSDTGLHKKFHLQRNASVRPLKIMQTGHYVRTEQLRVRSSGGSGGAGGSGSGSGGGGDGGDEGGSDNRGAAEALLLAAGRALDTLPSSFAHLIKQGRVTVEILKRYLDMERNPLLRQLLQFPGFRDRLLADDHFIVKVAIELGIGFVCKIAAEYEKRKSTFKQEIDFVFANVVMALIADFMLVWLPAPTLTYGRKPATTQNAVSRFFSSCPDNAFQVVPAGVEPWGVGQRAGAVLRNGSKLLGVGFFASLFGVSVTNILVKARMMMDPDFRPPNAAQNVLAMSGGYAVYMSTSSNFRYQVIAGVIEERGIEKFLGRNALAVTLLSFLVRTGNTFLGSLLWVDFLRLTGLQKKTKEE